MLSKQQEHDANECETKGKECIECSCCVCIAQEPNSEMEMLFPQVTEALRMVLHDGTGGLNGDKAEEIMLKAYRVMNENGIKPPKFFKE